MSDSARKREKIVSLSQAEIMFVIAAVMLVLFMLADARRQTAQTEERAAREELRAAREAADGGAQEEEDMLAEVVDILTAEGALAAESGPAPRLRRAIPDAVRDLARQKNESEKAQQEIDAALGADETENVEPRTRRIRRLLQDAARGEAAAKALGVADAPPATVAAEIEKLRQAADANAIRAQNQDLRRAVDAKDARIEELNQKLRSFLPCWLGRGAGEPQYYFALTVEYRSGQYKIEPHQDLRAQAAVVQSALAGELALLLSPPSGWIGEEEFERFGRQAQKQKFLQYPNAPECELVAELNRSASGHQVRFVHRRAKFYPIYDRRARL